MKLANNKMGWKVYLMFSMSALVLTAMQEAMAVDAITALLCKVVNLLTGTIGSAVATIGIVVLGIGLFTGKLSWTTAIATALGIGIVFGAASLVSYLTPTSGGGTVTSTCATSVTTS